MRFGISLTRTVAAAVVATVAVAGINSTQAAQPVQLLETGSSLLYPLFNI